MSRSGFDPPPACLADALALIEAGLDFVNAEDLPGLPTAVQADALRAWSRLDAKRTAAEAALIGAFDASEGYAADGQSATSSWLAFFTRCTLTAARQMVAGARRLRDHLHVARALAAGHISTSIGRLIMDFCGRLPADDREPAEQVLTDAAEAGADAADLSMLATEIYRRVYPNGIERDEERVAADRGLTIAKTFGGVGKLNGDLTAHATSLAEQVIGALSTRKGPEDARTPRQRRHDALVQALSLLVGSNLLPERGGAKPQVKVDIPLAALRRLPGADDAVNEWIRLKAHQLAADTAFLPGHSAGHDASGQGDASPTGCPCSESRSESRSQSRSESRSQSRSESRSQSRSESRSESRSQSGSQSGSQSWSGSTQCGGSHKALHNSDPRLAKSESTVAIQPAATSGGRCGERMSGSHSGRPEAAPLLDPALTPDILTRQGLPPAAVGPPAALGGAGPISERMAAALTCDSVVMPTVTGFVDHQALSWMTEECLRGHGMGEDGSSADAGAGSRQPPGPADRRRLGEVLLRWAVEMMSGPDGLASYLRTGHYVGPLASPSIVLDVGRPTKTVPTHLEQAVRRRDRHCRWPGCDRPAELSQVHHIVPRAAGGHTRLDNLLSLCDFHHLITVHTWGWTIRLGGDGTTTAVSPGGRILRESEPPATGPPGPCDQAA